MNREEAFAKYAQDKDLSEADLSRAELSRADLRYANLSRADLRYANLRFADLSGANLSEATLSGADLSEADLSGADLSGANLSGANLPEVNLSGANLSGANLSGADLSEANLSGCMYNPVTLLCMLDWGSLSDELCNKAMNFDCQNHPKGREAFQRWLDTGDCPYLSTNILRAVQFQQAQHAFSFIDETINPLQLFQELCAEKKITL